MNIVSLVPVHPCREPIIQAARALDATLIWADGGGHFLDLLSVNSASFGVMASDHRLVPESAFIRHMLRDSLINPLYVMLLGKGSDHDSIVRALAAGADQAEIWPVDPRLLAAQIKAVIARDRGDGAEIIRFSGVEFNTTTGDIVSKIGRAHLTPVETAILSSLTRFPNRPLSKVFLHHVLYGGSERPELKIIDVFIHKVRKKLSAVCREEHIETVWGMGFRFHLDGFVPELTEMRVVSHRREAAE